MTASRIRTAGLTIFLLAGVVAGCQEQGGPESSSTLGEAVGLPKGLLATDRCLDATNPSKLVREMIDGINAERVRHKLPELRVSPDLMQVADFYACRMVDGHFFGHYDPYDSSTVDSRAADFGYAFIQIGENLAARQTSVHDAMLALMESPSHRANILDPIYTEVGVAVKVGGEHGIYWVQEFGRPVTDELPPNFDLDESDVTPKTPGVPGAGEASAASQPATSQSAD